MLQRELEEATRIAREAGRLVMDVYAGAIDVRWKGPSDPVTTADETANAYIVAELARLFPGDGIIAEESADRSSAIGARRCWYVDPLDGTKEFIAKNGEFAVMIGLAIDQTAVLGVVFQPTADRMYAGVIGGGAFVERGGVRAPLEVSTIDEPSQLRLVVSRSRRESAIDTFVQRVGLTDERVSGSVGLKIGLVAERVADLYVHPTAMSCLWDACAPEAILRAAGGVFLDLTGEPIRYVVDAVRNTRGLFACNAACAAKVLPIARDLARDVGLLR